MITPPPLAGRGLGGGGWGEGSGHRDVGVKQVASTPLPTLSHKGRGDYLMKITPFAIRIRTSRHYLRLIADACPRPDESASSCVGVRHARRHAAPLRGPLGKRLRLARARAALNRLPQFRPEVEGLQYRFRACPRQGTQPAPDRRDAWLAGVVHRDAGDHPAADRPRGAWRRPGGRVRSDHPVAARLWFFRPPDLPRHVASRDRRAVGEADAGSRLPALRPARRRLGCDRLRPAWRCSIPRLSVAFISVSCRRVPVAGAGRTAGEKEWYFAARADWLEAEGAYRP